MDRSQRPTGDDPTRFAEVRRANQSETAEDYVEAISDLVASQGEARVKDLAT